MNYKAHAQSVGLSFPPLEGWLGLSSASATSWSMIEAAYVGEVLRTRLFCGLAVKSLARGSLEVCKECSYKEDKSNSRQRSEKEETDGMTGFCWTSGKEGNDNLPPIMTC
jgi:hypothetical protein